MNQEKMPQEGLSDVSVLKDFLAAVRCDIQEILQSGNYYVTDQIAQEISVINHALEHLSLDNTFLATSTEWQKRPGNYSPSQLQQHLSGTLGVVNQVARTLSSVKGQLHQSNVAGKQENQLREIHQWVMSSLRQSLQNLEPIASDSANRIQQFGDTLGVSDRYNGYRHNLTYGSHQQPQLNTSWVNEAGEQGLGNSLTRPNTTLRQTGQYESDRYVGEPSTEFSPWGGVPSHNIGALKKQIRYSQTLPPMRITRGYRTIDSLYPKSTAPLCGDVMVRSSVMDEVKGLNMLNAYDMYAKTNYSDNLDLNASKRPFENLSVQEQAGIQVNYPGKTEYMIRYQHPNLETSTTDFKINPTPDFSIYGNPMQASCFTPGQTEYQTRYEWPDGSKIAKIPWLRN